MKESIEELQQTNIDNGKKHKLAQKCRKMNALKRRNESK